MQVRCPQCSSPIDTDVDDSLQDVTCPSCGSSFNLVGGTETIAYQPEAQTLGHFELEEQVGIGHFGSVWRARDTELDRTVAVKIPRKGQLSAQETEQFLREARAAAQLTHPNIVSVHEVGRTDESIYIVSDFVHGVTLADWLTGQSLTPREAAELCVNIAEALEHAHAAGIVHRDMKPGNIMITPDGVPHIMDFGLAKREVGEVTMTTDGQVLGTPAYMSPEQARGDAHLADRRADVYSLGVVLFQMLTGELPFRGNSRMMLHQVLHEEPPSPRKINTRVPRDLETVCLKCMEKEPKLRYETAGDVEAELQRYLKGEPIQARRVSAPARLWRWCRRKPIIAGLTLTVAVLLLFVSLAGPIVAWQQASLRKDAETSEQAALRAKADALTAEADAVKAKVAADAGRRAAETAQFQARTRVLEAYENLGQARFSQARVLWNDHTPDRQAAALKFLSEAGALAKHAQRLASAGKNKRLAVLLQHGGWQARTERFWNGHIPLLRSEAVRWLTETSVQELAKPPDVEFPNGGSIRSRTFRVQRPALALSPDGDTLAMYRPPGKDSRPPTIELIDTATGGLKKSIPVNTAGARRVWKLAVAFSADGKRLLIVRREQAGILGQSLMYRLQSVELKSGKVTMRSLQRSEGSYFSSQRTRFEFSPDRSRVLLRPPDQRKPTTVYSLEDGRLLASHPPDRTVLGLIGNDGGKLLDRSLSGVTRLVGVPSGKVLKSASIEANLGDQRYGAVVGTGPNGRWLAAFGPDRNYYGGRRQFRLRIFDTQTGALRATRLLHAQKSRYSFSDLSTVQTFSPDGRLLAIVTREWFYLISMPDAGLLFSRRHPVADPTVKVRGSSSELPWSPEHVEFAANGARLVLSLKQLHPRVSGATKFITQVWDVAAGEIPSKGFAHEGPVRSLAFASDNKSLISAGDDQILHNRGLKGMREWAAGYAPSQNGPRQYSGDFDPTGRSFVRRLPDRIDIWDAETGTLQKSFPRSSVVASDSRTRYLAVRDGSSGGVRVFDISAKRWQTTFRWDFRKKPTAAIGAAMRPMTDFSNGEGKTIKYQFSAGGKLLSACERGGTHARVGTVADGTTFVTVNLNGGRCRDVVISPDERHVLILLDADHPQSQLRSSILWLFEHTRGKPATRRVLKSSAGTTFELASNPFAAQGGVMALINRSRTTYNKQDVAVWRFDEPKLRHLKVEGASSVQNTKARKTAVADSSWYQTPHVTFAARDRLIVQGTKHMSDGNQRTVIELWDVGAKKLLARTVSGDNLSTTSEHTGAASKYQTAAVSYRRDGRWQTDVWNLKTGATLATHLGYHRRLSKDKRFALLVEPTRVVDMQTGRVHLTPNGTLLSGHSGFTPDGKAVVTRDFRDGVVMLWPLDQTREAMKSGPLKRLIQKIYRVDVRKRSLPAGRANSYTFSPDGRFLVTYISSQNPSLKIWNLASGKLEREIIVNTGSNVAEKIPIPLNDVRFSSDGKRLAFDLLGQVRIVDFATGRMQAVLDRPSHTGAITSLARSSDGKLIATASADQTVCLWNAKTGTFDGMLHGFRQSVAQVAFSSDGLMLLTRETDGRLVAWKLRRLENELLGQTMQATVAWTDRSGAECLAVHPSQPQFVTGHSDGRIQLRDLATGKLIRTLKTEEENSGVTALVFAPDAGRLAAIDTKGTLSFRDLKDNTVVGKWETGQGLVHAIAVSPGGSLIATAGNGTVLWQPGTQQPVMVYRPQGPVVRAVAFSADGNVLALGGDDHRAHLVNLKQLRARLNALKLAW